MHQRQTTCHFDMILATNELPDEKEKNYLLYLVYNSCFGYVERSIILEEISLCNDYEKYQQLQFKLEVNHKSIDQVPNPSKTDINKHINKLI